MRLDDLPETENVDDRRGQGGSVGGIGGRGLAIGGGGLGTVVIVVILMLLGVDPSQLLSSDATTAPQEQSQSGAPAGPRADDAAFTASRRVVGSTEEVWTALFNQAGRQYRPAVFTPYTNGTQTGGCGAGQTAMGPFYCPADQRVYIDLAFFDELATRFGAPGQFAQAYVIAHEVGHHVQQQLGISAAAEEAMQRSSQAGANRISVRLELQADCYAGVWANRANAQHRGMIEPGDVEQGMAAANAVGDDTLQRASRGQVSPDSFTHGSSAQRMQWFRTGLDSGDPRRCDTFNNGQAF